jgi:glycine cleavage system H protein
VNGWPVPEELRYDVNDYWVRVGGADLADAEPDVDAPAAGPASASAGALGGDSPGEGSVVTIGLTAYGQDSIGDLLYLDLPAVGSLLVRGVECGSLESGKWAGMLRAPLGGVVHRVNPLLAESLRIVNDDPFGAGWLFEVRLGPTGAAEFATLLTPAEYRASITYRECAT